MRRSLLILLALPSLLLLVATLALWVRSARALDEVDGRLGFTGVDLESYAGRLDVRLHRPYRLRADVEESIEPRYDELELVDDPLYRGDYLSRQRWPLGQTSRWVRDATYTPRPTFEWRIAWARDGAGRYDGIVTATVPYWLATLPLAIAPTLAAVSIARRRRRSPHACAACGYDCRASPDRCPECGEPRTKKAARG